MTAMVRDIERAIARRFPPERAESWDRVGLLTGDPDREVTGVALALDPTRAAIASAVEMGANVLVTHHPAFLGSPPAVLAGGGPGGVVFAALDAGVALINAHTNLDRDAAAQALLPAALGLEPLRALETAPMEMAVVTVYVPEDDAERLVAAMREAGAGRIGDYEGCSFTAAGVGAFVPGPSSRPAVGQPGQPSSASEARVEMVCPRAAVARVIAAAASTHPYEEPLVTASDVLIARNASALGMVCEAPRDLTLRGLATVAGATFNVTTRVWGDPDQPVRTLVTATGSAGSLVPVVAASGAQALVAGEVRYHDALEAVANGVAVLELGHDVTEWPLVGLLHKTVASIPGIDADAVHMLAATPGWWTT